MYLRLLILMYGLNVLHIVSWVIFTVSIIGFVVIGVLHLVGICDGFFEKGTNNFFKKPIWKKWWKILGVTATTMFFIGVIVNEPKNLIGMAIANQVDKYIAENVEAIYEPQKILDVIDKGINKIENLIDNKMEE